MKTSKCDKLVEKAMLDLYEGSAILTHDWLDDNKCNHDDALYISESIAHSIKMYHFNGNEGKEKHKLTDFEMGILTACGLIMATHDEPGIAADVIRETGLQDADCSDLDDFDKEYLKIIQEQERLNLTGLD